MKHNYMIIDPESLVWRNYECRMMTANTMEGVLHFQLRQVDDEVRFFYEITSKQPLSRLLESRSIRTEELRCLILGIAAVLDRMEGYLLREGSILLEPEYIYMEPESFRIWLCLVPGLERDFPEDYGKLLEYLLGKVDHQDKDSVVLAYGLYQETRKDNYGMEDILRLLYSGETRNLQEETRQRQEVRTEEKGIDIRIKEEPEPVNPWFENQKEEERSFEKKPSLLDRIRGWWNHRFCNHKSSVKTQERGNAEFAERPERHLHDRPERQLHDRPGRQLQEKAGRHFQETADEVQMPWEMMFREDDPEELPVINQTIGQNTVLLTDLSNASGERPHRLRALTGGMDDIELPYYPFVIGKQQNLADYIISKEAVSRLHLRIDCKDNHYYVQDLNSTNGTSVRGNLLDNNGTTELWEGDEVSIAGYRYRFE